MRILDVQRSGQIPEAILYDEEIAQFCPDELTALIKVFTNLHQGSIGNYVDWYKVVALGAIHIYVQEQHKQIKKHGMTESIKKYLSDEAEKEQLKAKKALQAKEDFKKNYFVVMQGVHVKKFQRAA